MRNIFITAYDLARLQDLVQARSGRPGRDRDSVDRLDHLLVHAHVVHPTEIPCNVVTMNSTVRLCDLDQGREDAFTVAFPSEADIAMGAVSVLAPMGTAILGGKVGDAIEWDVPGGLKRWRIQEILYQPEAAGHYHL